MIFTEERKKFRRYLKRKRRYYENVWYYHTDRISSFFRKIFKTKKEEMFEDETGRRKIKIKYSSNRLVENIVVYTKHNFATPKFMLVIVFIIILIIFLGAVLNKDSISALMTGMDPKVTQPLERKR